MTGKLYIKTHGCQMNEYDSDKMADVLAASHGLELTDSESDADVILINTCSIREKAQEKVFSQLGRWKNLKKDGKPVVIGVGGCVAGRGRAFAGGAGRDRAGHRLAARPDGGSRGPASDRLGAVLPGFGG